MIDRHEMQEAVESGDESKIFYFFSQITSLCGFKKHPMFEDWSQEAIFRAFRYLPSYTIERGMAFSYFYRIIKMQFLYEFRRTKNTKKLNAIQETPLNDDLYYEQELYGDAQLVEVAGYVFDKDDVLDLYNQYYNKHTLYMNSTAKKAMEKKGYKVYRRNSEPRKHGHEGILQKPTLEAVHKEDD
jgi:hypothetical protein